MRSDRERNIEINSMIYSIPKTTVWPIGKKIKYVYQLVCLFMHGENIKQTPNIHLGGNPVEFYNLQFISLAKLVQNLLNFHM